MQAMRIILMRWLKYFLKQSRNFSALYRKNIGISTKINLSEVQNGRSGLCKKIEEEKAAGKAKQSQRELTGVRAYAARQAADQASQDENIARIQALLEMGGKTYIPYIGTAREYTAAKQQDTLSPSARAAGGFSTETTPSLRVSPQNEINAAESRAKREIYSGTKDAVRVTRPIDTAKSLSAAGSGDAGIFKAAPGDFKAQADKTQLTERELADAQKTLNEAHAALTKTPSQATYKAYNDAYKNYNDMYQAFKSAGQRTTGENMGNVTGKSVWAGITDVTNAGWQLAALPFRLLGGAQEFLFPGAVNPLAEAGEYISISEIRRRKKQQNYSSRRLKTPEAVQAINF